MLFDYFIIISLIFVNGFLQKSGLCNSFCLVVYDDFLGLIFVHFWVSVTACVCLLV